ncbi:MAG TPA: A24 family peptidase [Candidatus Binatia bacterium]|nr:A24 family peptidase [Candidatus Binatia bacterium]
MLDLVIASVILLFGTVTDLRTTEVPDWLNYAGIAAGVGLHLLSAVLAWSWQPLIELASGLVVFVALGFAMYYAGQWGGGDSKLMMALGSIFGMKLALDSFAVGFLINSLVFGAIYGLGAIALIAARNYKTFLPAYGKLARQKPLFFARMLSLVLAILLLALVFLINEPRLRVPVIILAALLPLMAYALIVVKAVEQCCMLKTIPPSELREGDWIVKDVVVAGKRITGPKDLGVTKEQIAELQRLAKKHKILVEIKNGIPFVPSFLLAFVATLIVGNPLLLL